MQERKELAQEEKPKKNSAKEEKLRIQQLASEIENLNTVKKVVNQISKCNKLAQRMGDKAEAIGCLTLLVIHYRNNHQKLSQYLPKLKNMIEALRPCEKQIRKNSLLYEVYSIAKNLPELNSDKAPSSKA